MLFLFTLAGVLSTQAESTKNVRDYLKELPQTSEVRQKCEACKGARFLGVFKSKKEKACQKLNQVFNDADEGVKYEPGFLGFLFYEFYASLLGGGNYHLEHQRDLLKDAIRTILAGQPDDQKWKELKHCQELIERIPEIRKARKQREEEERIREWREKLNRF